MNSLGAFPHCCSSAKSLPSGEGIHVQGTPLCCPRYLGNISAALLAGILDNYQTINSLLKDKINIPQCKFRNIYLFSWHEGVWLTSSLFIKSYPGKMEVLAYLFCSQVFFSWAGFQRAKLRWIHFWAAPCLGMASAAALAGVPRKGEHLVIQLGCAKCCWWQMLALHLWDQTVQQRQKQHSCCQESELWTSSKVLGMRAWRV